MKPPGARDRQVDRFGDGRVRGHVEEEELVKPESQNGSDFDFEIPIGALLYEPVQGPTHPSYPVNEVGGEVAVATLEIRVVQELGKNQVGKGTLFDREQGFNRQVTGRGSTHARRSAGSIRAPFHQSAAACSRRPSGFTR